MLVSISSARHEASLASYGRLLNELSSVSRRALRSCLDVFLADILTKLEMTQKTLSHGQVNRVSRSASTTQFLVLKKVERECRSNLSEVP